MRKRKLSADEVISALNHSSLPTLVSEGDTDAVVLRRLESQLGSGRVSVMPVGGRSCVLKVFRRRSELKPHIKVGFIADKDTWVYHSIPAEYIASEILFTDGYSIENDLYRDGDLERLLTDVEAKRFSEELEKFVAWYALQLNRSLSGKPVTFKDHPSAVLDASDKYDAECMLAADDDKPDERIEQVKSNYKRVLRGKSLLALLLRQLSSSKRTPKHSGLSLLEHAATNDAHYMGRIRDWADSYF